MLLILKKIHYAKYLEEQEKYLDIFDKDIYNKNILAKSHHIINNKMNNLLKIHFKKLSLNFKNKNISLNFKNKILTTNFNNKNISLNFKNKKNHKYF